MDQKHLDNYRQVVQSVGGSQGSPDKVIQTSIGECKPILGDPNTLDVEKLGLYTLLVNSAKEGCGLIAHCGAVKGDQNISRLMSECFHEDFYHIEVRNTYALKEISQMS